MDNEPELERKNLTFETLEEYVDNNGEVLESVINAGFPFTFSLDDVPTVEHAHALLEAWYGENRTITGNDEQGYSYLVDMPDGFYIVDISENMGVNECLRYATRHEAQETFEKLTAEWYGY